MRLELLDPRVMDCNDVDRIILRLPLLTGLPGLVA